MAKTKISKVAKELNVALPTVFEFLSKNNISVEESPNARVEDNVVDMLVNEFSQDKDLKRRSEIFSSDRQKERVINKTAKKDTPEKNADDTPAITAENTVKPRIIGKLDLDANGRPVIKKPGESDKPAQPSNDNTPDTAAKEQTVRPVNESNKKPVENKIVEKKEEKSTTEVNKPKVNAQQHNNNNAQGKNDHSRPAKNADNSHKAQQPTNKPAETKPAANSDSDNKPKSESEVFSPSRSVSGPTLNIVGKIDLSAINQTTRPKKKTKEERRNERNARNNNGGNNGNGGNGNNGGNDNNGDRKKRRRIGGKEKVDIEKIGQQTSEQSRGERNRGGNNNGNNNGNSGNNNRRDRDKQKDNSRNRRPIPAEVSEEDVSKQVKETLARLTSKDKGLKRGAKWRKEKREANANREREAQQAEMAESKVLKLTEFVTVHDLSIMMDVPINNVIATCMNLGVMVSINQRLDAETINIVAEEFGFRTEYVSAEVVDAIAQVEDSEEDLLPRPPVVTVMGHVDHGKTSLLDYIRKANVIAGEAGGITQHIGSYSVTLSDGRHITFLDTPGHEAFTAMRARGAKVTDICIIIVAADDSVMPQTIEAINHASAAGVPIVFAINKIDKPHANPDKIKEELAAMNYLVEEWGGKYQSQDISAKKGIGVNELMEKVLLEAEMLDLKANPNRQATGTIIESSLDKGRGYVANVLVQNGTLHVGDIVLAGNNFGKIKAMFNERNQRIQEAGPAMPALILGLNGAPTAGDTFNVLETEQEAREIANKREQLQREQGLRTTKILTLEDIGRRRAIGNFQELNIIVKGDVDGSIEALSDSLIKLSTEEIQVNVLHKAVGEISESDVTLAAASDAIIIGFQVRPSQAARRAAERDGVDIRLYSVIYQAIEEVKDAMAGMLAPEIKEEITGSAEVLETYHISRVGTIAGAMVREGKIKRSNKVRLIRDGIVRYTGDLGSLKRFKDDVKEVSSGYDCGLSIAGYNDIKIGDIIEGFEEVKVARSI
jgi:translation initiation factor IF-2